MKSYSRKEADKINEKYAKLSEESDSNRTHNDLTLKEFDEIKEMRPHEFNIVELREIVIKIAKEYNLPPQEAFTAFKKSKHFDIRE